MILNQKRFNLRSLRCLFLGILVLCAFNSANATVKFDGRSFLIDGILLMQDAQDTNGYYYIPKFPTISMKNDSVAEFLLMKYVGDDSESSGGLFHTLIEFTASDELLNSVLKKLKKKLPKAKLLGRLPFLPSNGVNGDFSGPTFEIISSIVTSPDNGEFTRSIVASGNAPMTPGSKAAVAAMLDSRGATLLWNSLTSGESSDLSVGVKAYYEAQVPAFNAIITIDMKNVYTTFINDSQKKRFFSEKNIKNRVDSVLKSGGIKIDIVDKSQAFDIDNAQMNSLVDMITGKVTDMLFKSAEGPMKAIPEGDATKKPDGAMAMGMDPMMMMMMMGGGGAGGAGVMMGMMAGNMIIDKVLANNKNTYILKNAKEVNLSKYKINLNKTSTIKMPFYTAGNLSLFYNKFKNDDHYFKIVDMNDPDFQRKEITFQVDGTFIDTFDDLFNYVSVKIKKTYGNGEDDFMKEITFNKKDIENGLNLKTISFPRMGLNNKDWQKYQYQVTWSLKGKEASIQLPANENEWLSSSDPAISLAPPLEREELSVDAERNLFIEEGFSSAQIRFASIIAGEPTLTRRLLLKSNDTEWGSKVSIFHDIDKPIVYETTWYSGAGETKIPLKVMDSDYLYVVPPHQEIPIDEFRRNNPLAPKEKATSPEINTQENTNQQEEGTEQIQEEGTDQQQEEGTEDQQGEGTEEQQGEGTEEQPVDGTEEQQEEGTEEQQEEGTEEQPIDGTEEQQEEGTEEQSEEGTEEQPEDGTEQQEEEAPPTPSKPPVRNSKPPKRD